MSATLEIIKEPTPFRPENVIGLLISNADYTIHVEFGTQEHDINSPVKIKGNWVYIKTHPGTKAQPFLKPAVLMTRKKFPKLLAPEFLKEKPDLRNVMKDYLFLYVVPQAIELAPADTGNLRRLIEYDVL